MPRSIARNLLLLMTSSGPAAPVNTVAPVITGAAPQQGDTLSVSDGTWTGAVSYTYQWKRDGVSIGSATNATYLLVSADRGTYITCTVTATNAAGSASATSAAVRINLLVDGNMEAPTAAAYSSFNAPTLTKETTSPHGGTRVLRVARTANTFSLATQAVTMGAQYRATGWTRSDGTGTPRVMTVNSIFFTGTTSTSWQFFDVTFTADATDMCIGVSAAAGTPYAEFDDVFLVPNP